jgi:hypothetical protein
MIFFFYNNKMMYTKIDFKKKIPPSYDQFIIQYQLLILN